MNFSNNSQDVPKTKKQKLREKIALLKLKRSTMETKLSVMEQYEESQKQVKEGSFDQLMKEVGIMDEESKTFIREKMMQGDVKTGEDLAKCIQMIKER